jgi:hypothetical protein
MILSSFEQLDYDMAPSPEQLLEIYSNGFKGVRKDPSSYYSLRTSSIRFYDAFPEAKGAGKGRLSLPFKAAVALDEGFGSTESQTTGDCVSHGARNGGAIDYSIDALFGETEYQGRFATENIYGWRGHGGQGASCARLSKYVSQQGPGGFLTRKKYSSGSKSVDLSVYNSSIGHNWGRSGTPSWLNEIAAQNKALRVFSVKSLEEVIDALAMGFGINMCSGYGFSNKRNEDGLSEQRGSWAHAMAWVGVDDTDYAHQQYNGPVILIQNSWGKFNSGPKRHEQPDGSFFIRPSVADKMVRGGGGWVIASVRGYNRELVYDMQKKVAELSND